MPDSDPFPRWLDALERRHRTALTFQEVRRSVQALSQLYVERRHRLEQGSPLEGAGKRAAFASYFAPLHFLLVREITRALDAGKSAPSEILDLGCGTGIAGAAWALEINPPPRITAVDRNSWATQEAKWNAHAFGLRMAVRQENIEALRITGRTGVIAAFAINELSDEGRQRMLRALLSHAQQGMPVLIIEPIARSALAWWQEWAEQCTFRGGREDEWRFRLALPESLSLMDKAAGLDHRELTGRSLWLAR